MKRKFRDESSDDVLSYSVPSRKKRLWFALASLSMLLLAGLTYFIARDLPSIRTLEQYTPKLASKVYSADMKVIHEFYEQRRSFTPLDETPEALVNALIATEDRKFYSHWGLDLLRLIRVAAVNVVTLQFKPKAVSTITQQLARQLYLTLERSLARKIREMITAIQIERLYTKEEILEMYLNHMNFGHGAWGAQSAAIKFFGKDIGDLTVDECALLIGLLKAPSNYTPFNHPERALARRKIVLSSMRELGYITDEEYEEYESNPIEVLKTKSSAYGLAPYFTEYIRRILDDKYGYNLYTDGLSIYTTIDSRAQAAAEKAVAAHLKKLQQTMKEGYIRKKLVAGLVPPSFSASHDIGRLLQDSTFVDSLVNAKIPVQAALVSIDPRTGHILAFVGGRDFKESKFIRVTQARRQPGSSFKPFVYTVAVDNGYQPTHEVLNQPVVVELPTGDRWTPKNYDGSIGGPTTFREGIKRSLNLVTVRVMQQIIKKPATVVEYAHKMGINSKLQPVDALALGTSEVTPLEITSAYGVFANAGILVRPIAFTRIEDKNGNIIDQVIPERAEVLPAETAYIMTDMLRSVMDDDRGTGRRARWGYQFNRPAGGKSGTTNDHSDAWFLGFTPQMVTGVWVGIDDHRIKLEGRQTGSSAALPIWAPYMKAAHDTLNLPELDFPIPLGIVRTDVCMDTKLLANEICPNVREEVFESRFAPTKKCGEHVGLLRPQKGNSRKDKRRIRF